MKTKTSDLRTHAETKWLTYCPIYVSFVYFFNPFVKSKNIVYLLQTCVPSSKVIALCRLELPYIAFKII